MGAEAALIDALNSRVVVAAVGPVCRAALEEAGIRPHVVPTNPKMGPLIAALAEHCSHCEPTGCKCDHEEHEDVCADKVTNSNHEDTKTRRHEDTKTRRHEEHDGATRSHAASVSNALKSGFDAETQRL